MIDASVSASSSIAQTASGAAGELPRPSPRRPRSPGLRARSRAARRRGGRFGRATSAASLAGVSGSVDIVDAKRIRDRIGDADRRRHAIAFADALCAERSKGRRRLHVEDLRLRHLGGGRQQIVGERARQKTPSSA